MLGFLRHGFAILVALIVGYLLGNGPFAEWVTDVGHQMGIAWATERASRGPGGTLPLLLAGYLLGQGIFLLARGLAKQIEPWRAHHTERIASWDASLKLGTRFGLYQYLEQCGRWAAEDPTTRTQCLVLFRIRGLGALNKAKGTLGTTTMLQHIAAELRAASLPDSSSAFARWRYHHLPRALNLSASGLPAPRYPSRWSGATFALAFRELDAVQAVVIARELADWISKELRAASPVPGIVSMAAAVAVGGPGATGRALSKAASRAVDSGDTASLRVLCDPADVRAPVISQMSDVQHEPVTYEQRSDVESTGSANAQGLGGSLRMWGPAFGCLIGAGLLLGITGEKHAASVNLFPWPDSLNEVQVVEASGPKTVHLIRRRLADQQTSNWQLSNAMMIQGNEQDGSYPLCQFRVTVTNRSRHAFYVSVFDFAAIDSDNRALTFEPLRMLRMDQGIIGRWMAPGESWSGWLLALRRGRPLIGLQFEPDRTTRVLLTSSSPLAAQAE